MGKSACGTVKVWNGHGQDFTLGKNEVKIFRICQCAYNSREASQHDSYTDDNGQISPIVPSITAISADPIIVSASKPRQPTFCLFPFPILQHHAHSRCRALRPLPTTRPTPNPTPSHAYLAQFQHNRSNLAHLQARAQQHAA